MVLQSSRRGSGTALQLELRGWLARVLVSALILLVSVPMAGAQELQDVISTMRSRTNLGSASFGGVAIDPSNGRVLFAIDAKTPMIPASNQKLLTSGAALMVLGPDFVFETVLSDAGNRLVLRGSGDPALGDPVLLREMGDIGIEDLLTQMVEAVKRRGIEQVDEIVIDDRVFDREFAHPSWPIDQLNTWYCAEIGGANLHTNVLAVYPKPDADGRGLPVYTVEPAVPWIEIANFARTVKKGRQTVWIARPKPINEFQLRGDVRYPGSEPIRVAFHNPPLTTGKLLADRLMRAGIEIGVAGGASGLDAVRLADADEVFAEGQPLIVIKTRMEDILRRCNTDSYNLYAEALIKRLGNEINHEPGSWDNGSAVIRMLLAERLGPEHAMRTRVADGSGMSRDNKVSAETLLAWLLEIDKESELREAMIGSMATPGVGTLRKRFVDSDLQNTVYAKSGYLNGVRALSGFIVAENGREVIFTMLMNDIPAGKPNQNSRRFLERVVEKLDVWLTDRVLDETSALGG
jgi:serine-type D-Ala-D-Ala carboxypeptidase/endopeptidase (penicillin-binding protein 4)